MAGPLLRAAPSSPPRWDACVLSALLGVVVGVQLRPAVECQCGGAGRRLDDDARTSWAAAGTSGVVVEGGAEQTVNQLLGLTPGVLGAISRELDALGLQPHEREPPPLTIPSGRALPKMGHVGPENGTDPYPSRLLQEAFVRFTTLLFDHGLLPIAPRNGTSGIDGWGVGRGSPSLHSILSRAGMELFLTERAGALVEPGSTCLFWDDTSYLELVPGCDPRRAWVLTFAPVRPDAAVALEVVHGAHNTLRGDLAAISNTSMAGAALGLFDAVLCVQVFEHIMHPFAAARALTHLLKPGGRVFFTAPFVERFHGVPTDGFRYTVDGAAAMFTDAGLSVEERWRIGDTLLANAFTLGFGVGDFEPSRLHERLLIPDNLGPAERLSQRSRMNSLTERNWDGTPAVPLDQDPRHWLYISSALVLRAPFPDMRSELAARRIPLSPHRVQRARRATPSGASGAGLAVVAMMPRDSAQRAAFAHRALAASEQISEVLFADACFLLRDPAERELVLAERTFSHLRCTPWINMAYKRVGNWVAQLRALEIAARRLGPSILVEDDVRFSAGHFALHLPRALRLADDADLVYLGSCYERTDRVTQCAQAAPGLFAFRPVQATCGHGWLVSPAGALAVIRAFRGFLDTYHAATKLVQPPRDCSRAYWRQDGLARPSGDDEYLDAWTKYIQVGADWMTTIAYQRGQIRALHVWPQLLFQGSGDRSVHPVFHYQRNDHVVSLPAGCGLREAGRLAQLLHYGQSACPHPLRLEANFELVPAGAPVEGELAPCLARGFRRRPAQGSEHRPPCQPSTEAAARAGGLIDWVAGPSARRAVHALEPLRAVVVVSHRDAAAPGCASFERFLQLEAPTYLVFSRAALDAHSGWALEQLMRERAPPTVQLLVTDGRQGGAAHARGLVLALLDAQGVGTPEYLIYSHCDVDLLPPRQPRAQCSFAHAVRELVSEIEIQRALAAAGRHPRRTRASKDPCAGSSVRAERQPGAITPVVLVPALASTASTPRRSRRPPPKLSDEYRIENRDLAALGDSALRKLLIPTRHRRPALDFGRVSEIGVWWDAPIVAYVFRSYRELHARMLANSTSSSLAAGHAVGAHAASAEVLCSTSWTALLAEEVFVLQGRT